MFNNLQGNNDQFFTDDGSSLDADEKKSGKGGMKFNSNNFLGMTALQRFVISFMLMLVVVVLGAMVLLVLGKIQPF